MTEKEELYKMLKSVISKYRREIKKIPDKTDSEINAVLWEIRARLEMLIVDIVHYYDLPEAYFKWQTTFLKKKEIGAKTKAIEALKKFNKTPASIIKIFETDVEKGYKYLWTLKETLSLTLNAFPKPKFVWRNGELKKQSEEIFEI